MILRLQIGAAVVLSVLAASLLLVPQTEAQTRNPQTQLPRQAPAPQTSPQSPSPAEVPQETQALPVTPPTPRTNPEEPETQSDPAVATDANETPEIPQALPASPPAPDERPADGADEKPSDTAVKEEAPPAKKKADGAKPEQGPPLPAEMVGKTPPAELTCQAELKKLGVVFETREPESDEDGCSLPYPVSVRNFGQGISVEPPALINCATALTTAKFLQTTVKPASQKHLNTELTGIANGSGYVCRPRRGTQKLSEHALGNAIDIMSFTFANDKSVIVEATEDKAEGEFLNAVRKAACGPFKTVLGPGSDADHANHFHLDLAERRNGSTFCH